MSSATRPVQDRCTRRSPRTAPLFYLLIAAGALGGAALTLSSVDPITLLVLVADGNGIAAAPFLIVVMIICGNGA